MHGYEPLADPAALTVFILTLFLPVLVGVLTLRRTRNQSDFFIGGRAMDKITVALSAVSSGRSSWLVLGVSGMAYTMGVGAVWAVVGYILAELFQFVTIGRRLRTETESMDALTLLDYFESRFRVKDRGMGLGVQIDARQSAGAGFSNQRIQHAAADAAPPERLQHGHAPDLAVGLHPGCAHGAAVVVARQHMHAVRIPAVDLQIGRHVLSDHEHLVADPNNVLSVFGIWNDIDAHHNPGRFVGISGADAFT